MGIRGLIGNFMIREGPDLTQNIFVNMRLLVFGGWVARMGP